jgi:hypothetical protein
MSHIKSYNEFISESDEPVAVGQPKISLNFADETLTGLRQSLLDKYYGKVSNTEDKEKINKCITTYVYALDKKLKIDEDIIKMMAGTLGMTHEELTKELTKETTEFYDKSPNVIG